MDTSIRETGELRFLPVVLTSLTAIGGLMSIALSSNLLISPLAIVLIGGLGFDQLNIIVPDCYAHLL